MAEPYYRISAAKSELEDILYGTGSLADRVGRSNFTADGAASITSIKMTHIFPFRTEFNPIILTANQYITHENTTNNHFVLEYGGEYMSNLYQVFNFGAAEIAPVNQAHTITFAYCENFIAHYVVETIFKVATDELYKLPGQMYYIWYSLIVPLARRPALTRCLHETCWEFKWMVGADSGDLADQYGRTTAGNVLTLQHPYTPIQAFRTRHEAFTIYMPLSLWTLSTIENAYPIAAIYSLTRKVEFTLRSSIYDCINVHLAGAESGLIRSAPDSALYTWVSAPRLVKTTLVAEYHVLHQSLQKVICLNPHGYLIRQYFLDTETVAESSTRELSVTKIIETIYLLARHSRNVTPTPTGATLNLGEGLLVPTYHLIDPFFLPANEHPIDTVNLTARGQSFYKGVGWDEISSMYEYLYTAPDMGTTTNHAIGVITFGHHYHAFQQTSSYNSGYGPNLRVGWLKKLFSNVDPGIMEIVVQGSNLVLIYRGSLSIRYT